jgi:hypothetical protein
MKIYTVYVNNAYTGKYSKDKSFLNKEEAEKRAAWWRKPDPYEPFTPSVKVEEEEVQ